MKDDKRLKRKVRNSYIVSTVSITLVLFLLGSVGYLMVAALKVADTLQESIAVTVELKNGLSEAQKETISKRLTAEEMVATIAYSAKEEKAEEDDAGGRRLAAFPKGSKGGPYSPLQHGKPLPGILIRMV